MNMKGVGNIIGAFVGLATVAVIAANPSFLSVTFKGISGLISSAVSPVTNPKKKG